MAVTQEVVDQIREEIRRVISALGLQHGQAHAGQGDPEQGFQKGVMSHAFENFAQAFAKAHPVITKFVYQVNDSIKALSEFSKHVRHINTSQFGESTRERLLQSRFVSGPTKEALQRTTQLRDTAQKTFLGAVEEVRKERQKLTELARGFIDPTRIRQGLRRSMGRLRGYRTSYRTLFQQSRQAAAGGRTAQATRLRAQGRGQLTRFRQERSRFKDLSKSYLSQKKIGEKLAASRRALSEKMDIAEEAGNVARGARGAARAVTQTAAGEAAGGAMLSGALKAGGAVVALGVAAVAAVKGMHDFAEHINETNRHLGRFSGLIAISFAKLGIGNIRREIGTARATEDTASNLADAVDKMRDAIQPLKNDVMNALNNMAAGFAKFIAPVFAKISEFFEEFSLSNIFSYLRIAGLTFLKWLKEVWNEVLAMFGRNIDRSINNTQHAINREVQKVLDRKNEADRKKLLKDVKGPLDDFFFNTPNMNFVPRWRPPPRPRFG